jgi:hypothetical protein
VQGVLVAADEQAATVRLDPTGATAEEIVERIVPYRRHRPCPHGVPVGPGAQARQGEAGGEAQGPRQDRARQEPAGQHREATKASARQGRHQQVHCIQGQHHQGHFQDHRIQEGGREMSSLDMSEAVKMLANEKNISVDTLLQVLVDALATAYKRRPGAAAEVEVGINPDTFEFTFTAFDIDEDGNWVNERDDTPRKEEMGRIAAQTFRQVMSQRIREAERDRSTRSTRTARATSSPASSSRADARYTCSTSAGSRPAAAGRAGALRAPQPGDRVKAYIVEVRKTAKGPQIVVSRTHPGLIKRLFELEVPEIADGIVEIKACAREPGHRTKIAVWSNDHNVDPVGACVGARGGRVRMVVNELRGEKIDIVPFSEDLADFVAKALSPAKVVEVGSSATTARRPTSSCPTTSSAWRSARRARTPASLLASPACASTSVARPSSTENETAAPVADDEQEAGGDHA